MAPIELPSVVVTSRPVGAQEAGDAVVCLHGDHDASTVAALTETMARVIASDDSDLVVDLSGVRFMGAATVEVLGRARTFLQAHSRSLALRCPPPRVSRVLELSGLADLVDPSPVVIHLEGTADALGTWVAVPATERAGRDANDPEPINTPESRASRVSTPSEASLDFRQHARGHTTGVTGRWGP